MNEQLQGKYYLLEVKVLNVVIAKVVMRLESAPVMNLVLNMCLNVMRETVNVRIANYAHGIIDGNYYYVGLLWEIIIIT